MPVASPGDYYLITRCCDASQEILVNISDLTNQLFNGVYNWTGSTTSITSNTGGQTVLDLVNGECYKIKFRGVNPTLAYTNINGNNLTIQVSGDHNTCAEFGGDLNCDCNSSNIYLKFDPCCGGDPIFYKGEPFAGSVPGVPQFDINLYAGIQQFGGWPTGVPTGIPTNLGQDLVVDQCYDVSHFVVNDPNSEVTIAQWYNLEYPPFITQLNYLAKDNCDYIDPTGTIVCAPCEQCYTLTDCNGVIIQTNVDLSLNVNTFIEIAGYTGSWFVQLNVNICVSPDSTIVVTATNTAPCPCICYEVIGIAGSIYYTTCEGQSAVTYAPDKFCSTSIPIVNSIHGEDYTLITSDPCINGGCVPKCFELINCDHEAYPSQPAIISSTLQSLSQYSGVNEVVVLNEYEGCWTVTEASCQCISLTINGIVFNAYATTIYNNSKVFTFDYETVTYYIWAGTYPGSWHITQAIGVTTVATELGYIGSGILNCPIATDSVWINGQGPLGHPIATLATALCDDQCHCAVNVTVIRNHVSCVSCIESEIGFEAYKLTNCENPNEITYSLQDLSIYVDNIVKDECKCWLVERIYTRPPSSVIITDLIFYSSCESCLATYYQLDNCDPDGLPLQIITASNLSAYVDKIVKIEGCDDCFTVTLYNNIVEPANSQDVVVSSDFEDCVTCRNVVPRCSTVFNTNVTDEIYSFINANGDVEQTALVKSGQSSLRYCVQRWVEVKLQAGIFNFYGDCTVFETDRVKTGFCVQYFPNDRKVKPGYNTPICSAEKYDKITCNFADIAYKKALELRYGISDCCPEGNEKWLVKKELIELQALTDPNYTCDPLTTCCSNPISQCTCNS